MGGVVGQISLPAPPVAPAAGGNVAPHLTVTKNLEIPCAKTYTTRMYSGLFGIVIMAVVWYVVGHCKYGGDKEWPSWKYILFFIWAFVGIPFIMCGVVLLIGWLF